MAKVDRGVARQIQSIVNQVENQKATVAKARDRLRALLAELSELEEAWTHAGESLDSAVEKLSELL